MSILSGKKRVCWYNQIIEKDSYQVLERTPLKQSKCYKNIDIENIVPDIVIKFCIKWIN